MATAKKPEKAKSAIASVEDFMSGLQHPLKPEIEIVLELIRSVNPGISEGIKWNAPSFFYKEWFATLNMRSNDAVQIIMHLGAKARNDIIDRIAIDDPENLLQWLGKDRASIKFESMSSIEKNGIAFQRVVTQWIQHL